MKDERPDPPRYAVYLARQRRTGRATWYELLRPGGGAHDFASWRALVRHLQRRTTGRASARPGDTEG